MLGNQCHTSCLAEAHLALLLLCTACPLPSQTPSSPKNSKHGCLGAQATMVGTWLLELYLDQLNRSLLEVKGKGEPLPSGSESNGQGQKTTEGAEGSSKALPVPDQLTQDLRAFLKRNVDVLDVNVTVSLLAGYGRLEDLMEYATYRKVSCSKLESFSLTAAAMQCNEAQCDAMHSAQCNALDSSGYFLLCSCWGQISYGHCSCSPPPPPTPPPHTHICGLALMCVSVHKLSWLSRLLVMALH